MNHWALPPCLFSAMVLGANDKGNCPPAPPATGNVARKAVHPPEPPGKTYWGTVSALLMISDKGFVCSAKVLHGVDKKTDAEVLSKLRNWHFNPARKDGHPVPVSTIIDVTLWRDKDGNVVQAPVEAAPHTTSGERGPAPDTSPK